MKSGMIWLIVVVVLLAGGWFLFGGGDMEKDMGSEEDGNVQVDDINDEPAEVTGPVIQEANLVAVGDYTGSGTATGSYEDGKYMHNVVADIGDPAEGKFYEGWLAGGFGFISTGMLEKEGDKYVLEFTSDKDLTSKYSKVVITEETLADGLDNKPEAHVIEGPWK